MPGPPRHLRPGLGLDHLCGAVLVPGLPGTCASALALPLCGAVLVPGLPGACAPAFALTASVAFPRGLGCPTCHMCLRLSWRAAASLGPSHAAGASFVLHTRFLSLFFAGSSEPNLFNFCFSLYFRPDPRVATRFSRVVAPMASRIPYDKKFRDFQLRAERDRRVRVGCQSAAARNARDNHLMDFRDHGPPCSWDNSPYFQPAPRKTSCVQRPAPTTGDRSVRCGVRFGRAGAPVRETYATKCHSTCSSKGLRT